MVWEAVRDLGIFTIGVAAFGWVARYTIKQYFNKELNRYQTELEKEKVVFSELHNERAKITAELYEKFIEFEQDMRALTDPYSRSEESKEEKLEDTAESGAEFFNFYVRHKIYFPEGICDTVEDLQSEMQSVFAEFQVYQPHTNSPNDPVDVDRWHESWKTMTEEEVPELKEELEEHFRDLLGVDGSD